jgi:O-antigen/teichoic acid export membrane protein
MSMQSPVRARMLRGGGATFFSQASTLGVQLLSVPLFLGYWGVEYYGAWLILSSFPAYFAMSDLGIGSAAANEMTMRASRDDREGAVEVFRSVWLFISVVSAALLVTAAWILWTIPVVGWLNITALDQDAFALTLCLLLLHVCIHMQGSVVAAGYRAVGCYAQSTFLGALFRVAEFGGCAAVLMSGGGAVAVAATYVAVRSASLVYYYRRLTRLAPWVTLGIRGATRSEVVRLAAPGIAFLGFPLGHALSGQGLVTAIGVVLGPAAVVVFSTTRTLVNGIRQVVGGINATVWPELSMAHGSGNRELVRSLHRSACKVSLWMAALGSLALLLLGRSVLTLWTSGAVVPESVFFEAMVLSAFTFSLWSTSIVVPSATNQHVRVAAVFLGVTSGGLLFAVALLPTLGLLGVAMALILIDAVMTVVVVRNSLTLVGDSLGAFLRSQVPSVTWLRLAPK